MLILIVWEIIEKEYGVARDTKEDQRKNLHTLCFLQ